MAVGRSVGNHGTKDISFRRSLHEQMLRRLRIEFNMTERPTPNVLLMNTLRLAPRLTSYIFFKNGENQIKANTTL